MLELETHPYDAFVPSNASILILGSFPGIRQTRKLNNHEEWFYSAERNKFWKIIEAVYEIKLETIADRKSLFKEKGIAITDVILKAGRKQESNLDQHLTDIVFNEDIIQKIVANKEIKKVLFTSQFVGKKFIKLFPNYSLIEYLPSPSPRFARMTLEEKIKVYKEKLPK